MYMFKTGACDYAINKMSHLQSAYKYPCSLLSIIIYHIDIAIANYDIIDVLKDVWT